LKTRGRDNSATQVIAGGFAERPEPPPELTPRQNAIWREVVASENPDFFSSAALRGLLADYCRRRASADEITEVIDRSAKVWAHDPEAIGFYDKFLSMRDREQKAMVRLAMALRLTNQSRYIPHVAARAAAKVLPEEPPWRKSA
jgi:hypothetical protein